MSRALALDAESKELTRSMRKSILFIAAVVAFAMVAAATDFPTSELYIGYNWTRFYPDSAFIPDVNANGGVGQFTYNFHKGIGATFDVGSVTKNTLNHENWDTNVTSYTLGPRYTLHSHGRFAPYVQVLFGGATASISTTVGTFVAPPVASPPIFPGVILPPGRTITLKVRDSETGFAMLVGGGLDIKLFKRMSFRPFEVDYYLSRFPSVLTGNDRNHNNLRATAGVNFLFGAK
jgi:hypothetical protein